MQQTPVFGPIPLRGVKTLVVFGFVCLLTVVLACGRKALPVLPDLSKPLAVEALDKQIDGERLTLSWQVAAAENRDALDHFVVYRSKMKLNPTLCKTCPLPFAVVARVDSEAAGSDSINYHETLQHGYWYAFKVVAVNSADTTGPESQTVQFEFP